MNFKNAKWIPFLWTSLLTMSFYLGLILCFNLMSQVQAEEISPLVERKVEEGLKKVKFARSREDLKSALGLFSDAINLAPNMALPYYFAGMVCFRLDWYECAIEKLNTYLKLSEDKSDQAEVQQVISEALQKKQQLVKTIKMMTNKRKWKMLDFNPKAPAAPPHSYIISTIFSFDDRGNLVAKNPYIDFKRMPGRYIPDEFRFVPVKFDGLFFEYNYIVFYEEERALYSRHGASIYKVITEDKHEVFGEIILNNPVRIKQTIFYKSKSVYYKQNTKIHESTKERLLGEVLYELQ